MLVVVVVVKGSQDKQRRRAHSHSHTALVTQGAQRQANQRHNLRMGRRARRRRGTSTWKWHGGSKRAGGASSREPGKMFDVAKDKLSLFIRNNFCSVLLNCALQTLYDKLFTCLFSPSLIHSEHFCFHISYHFPGRLTLYLMLSRLCVGPSHRRKKGSTSAGDSPKTTKWSCVQARKSSL